MAGSGRNQPCPCGSGTKAKRCCGVRRGPGASDLARAFLAEQGRMASALLGMRGVGDLVDLCAAAAELPMLDLSCQLRLPRLLSPELDRLRWAIAEDSPEEVDAALPAALSQVDNPITRAELARAVIALRDSGRVGADVAAAALLGLDCQVDGLVEAALLAALAVDSGVAPRPSGLVLAS